ncbi:hypothetical protein ABBQ38_002375 [Trebouxia sp. C0009 RCD-2024]
MSRRRKHLTQQELVPPTDKQQIVRAKLSRGSNIFEAETADGRDLLCFLPAKFNKKLWIKRGGFIVVEEGDIDTEDKVTATIVTVLYEQDVKALKKLDGVWPAAFDAKVEAKPNVTEFSDLQSQHQCDGSSDDDSMPPLHQNNNRQVLHRKQESDSSEDEQ